ncbi:MAG: Rne/Rng family ribonuclease [Aridibacter sp.]
MSKEMIVSVNGREKKIAIIENGQVTEFYIERGEENAGVVGNIYKGRVMRVLPGMQSAFVDIGLDRDAFLYVSDFFDEEEEIERIVMEKGKENTSKDEADKEVTDELHKKRLKRDKQIDDRQEKAEIEGVADIEDEQEEEAKDDSQDSSASQKKTSKRRRSRRGKRDDETDEKREDEKVEKVERIERETKGRTSKKKTDEREKDDSQESDESSKTGESKKSYERPVPTFEFENSGFERIVDESEDIDVGEMLKDAMMQEAIIDKVRAIEFDMESSDSAEVGSLIDTVSDQANQFQRVADEDEAEEEKNTKSKRGGKQKSSGRGGKRSANNEEETDANESAEENSEEETDARRTTKGRRSTKSRKGTVAKKTTRGRKSKKTEEENDSDSDENMEEKDSKQTKSSRGRKTSSRKTSAKSGRRSTKKKDDEKTVEDGEASVTENTEVSEMAVRRGSRGGRRRTPDDSGGKDPEKTITHKDKGYKSTDADKTITADDAIASAEFSKSKGNSGRRNNSRRREKSQPKISDLLQEGQEILVQIAKEPIARKGARITSHIALPGRYLVYMPTIEHLGVSRKIESAKERGRLRNLLEKVINGLNIPSGGFIVRTAGTDKSEEDIRGDAKYLSNTWNDIRKEAEKAKSPELIHQDLDIVQRLIRDQLSEDFTAIRVDSEDEYQRTIEFVNRIQPKMVRRVKFHTSDKPILEAYGVASEIDKALKHRVWLRSGGYLVINQTEALIAIDVNTGKFVGKGNERLEDTITKTNMEAVKEISRQIRLRDLGGIIVLDLIDMEDRRNRQKVLQALQENLLNDKSPTKVLSFNDFGLIIMTRKRVKQSLERTLCSPCDYCEGAGWVKSAQTVCYEILDEARSLSKNLSDVRHTTLRVHPEVVKTLRGSESEVLEEIEEYLGIVDVTGDATIHQEQFDFAFV